MSRELSPAGPVLLATEALDAAVAAAGNEAGLSQEAIMRQPGHFAFRTFEGVGTCLTTEQQRLVEATYGAASNDPVVQEIEGQFRQRQDYFKLEHSQRVARFGIMLAVCAGVTDPRELRQIARALRAHDVGMVVGETEADISLMQAAVYTTGGLSPAQRALVDTHTHTGRAYVERLGFSRLEQAIVFGHHNPTQLARHLTPAQLRYVVLAQMADITDAWCSQRPYPKAMLSPQAAAEEVLQVVRPDQALQDAYLRLVGVSRD